LYIDYGIQTVVTSGRWLNHPIKPWLFRTNKDKIPKENMDKGVSRRIPYCFVHKRSYKRIEEHRCLLQNAIKLWADTFGKPGPEVGNSLAYRGPENPTDYCCKSYTYGAENQPLDEQKELRCEWNNKHHKDALAIHWVDRTKGNYASARVFPGYLEDLWWPEAGPHWIRITDAANAAVVAHELGHGL
jgi:hypothetical protein